jgi:putative membrane protein
MDDPSSKDRLFTALLLALFFIGAGAHILEAARSGEKLSLALSNLIFGALALVHAWYMLGWRRAAAMFGFVFAASWTAESLSIATFLATPYTYTEVLGPRIGQVPVVVPVGWFMMIYYSSVIVNLIAEGKPVATISKGWWVAGLAFLTALVMTAWDLTLDPYMVQLEKAWVWKDGGAYFGIPFANYLSWVQTVFMISVAWRLIEPSLPPPPRMHLTRTAAAIPVVSYALIGLPDVFIGFPAATRVLSPFAMGIPVLIALGRLTQMPQPVPFPEPEP